MTRIREASAADGPALVGFFRKTPMRAGTEFVLDRGPDFHALLRLRGQSRSFVALRGEGVVGAVTALWHDARDGGRDLRVGEIVDLRVAPEARGGPVAARLLGEVARTLESVSAGWVLCLIGDRNRDAASLVSGGAGLPPLAALARYVSLHYPVWRVPPPSRRASIVVRPATDDDAALLDRLVRETTPPRRFAPAALFPWPDPDGMHLAWIAMDSAGRAVGALVVWDGLAVRRIRVTRYSLSDQLLRGAMAAGAWFGGAARLPPTGEPIRVWGSRWLGARAGDPAAVKALVRAALRAALEAGQHLLQLNFERNDPLLPWLPALPCSAYWSTLYGRRLGREQADSPGEAIYHADVALV